MSAKMIESVETIQEVWRYESSEWMLTEYERKPSTISLNVQRRDSDDCYSFRCLGTDYSVIEGADESDLNGALDIMAAEMDASDANVSVCSLWQFLCHLA